MNENMLTYKKDWKNGRHKLNAVAGFTMQGSSQRRFGYSSMQIPNESLGISGIDDGLPDSMTALLTENYLMSWLGRINYSFRSRYMFTVSFRADGSSKFSPDNRWGYFPSGAFAWRLGEEKFMRRLRFIDDAKLRISYGVTGNKPHRRLLGAPVADPFGLLFVQQRPARRRHRHQQSGQSGPDLGEHRAGRCPGWICASSRTASA